MPLTQFFPRPDNSARRSRCRICYGKNTMARASSMRFRPQIQTNNTRARKFGYPGRLYVRDVAHLLPVCVYCGSTEYLTLDHAIPLVRGGFNDWSNIVVACAPCNRKKGMLTATEFRRAIGLDCSCRAA